MRGVGGELHPDEDRTMSAKIPSHVQLMPISIPATWPRLIVDEKTPSLCREACFAAALTDRRRDAG
jgi:hypothetical protein